MLQVVGGDLESIGCIVCLVPHLHQHLQGVLTHHEFFRQGCRDLLTELVVLTLISVDQVIHRPVKTVLEIFECLPIVWSELIRCLLRSLLTESHLNKTLQMSSIDFKLSRSPVFTALSCYSSTLTVLLLKLQLAWMSDKVHLVFTLAFLGFLVLTLIVLIGSLCPSVPNVLDHLDQ